jgi:hypothetical protein
MSGKKEKAKHDLAGFSLVAWRCVCGGSWRNDQLKGKTDDELGYERDANFEGHLREMKKEGF